MKILHERKTTQKENFAESILVLGSVETFSMELSLFKIEEAHVASATGC